MSDASADQRRSPWTRPLFVGAGAFVFALVALGVGIAVLGPAHDRKAGLAAPAPAASSASAGAASGCALPAGDQSVPQSAPAGTMWELVGTMAAPTAPARYGPANNRDGVRVCFAHNPVGALYAAVNVVATTTRPQLRLPLVRTLAAPGSGRDTALRRLASEPAGDSPDTQIQVAGFSVLNYTPQNTTVDVAIRIATPANSGYGHLPIQLSWLGDDWRVVLPDSGDINDNAGALPSLSGYIPWSGA